MKKKLFSFAAICVIFAAVFAMTGCPTPDDNDGSTTTKYKVTFNLNYTGAPAATSKEVEKGKSLGTAFPADPVQTGKDFVKWNTQANGGGTDFNSSTIVNGNVTVYAQWADQLTSDKWRVTFDGNGGTVSEATRDVTKNAAVGTLPVPTRSGGYSFVKWNTQANGNGTDYTAATSVTASVTLYAIWQAVDNTTATLGSVRFGSESATLGTPAATYAAATAGAVTILQPAVTVTATATSSAATIDYAVVRAGETLDEDDLWPQGAFTDLATGDQIAIKVTAGNGTTKLYYKIGITLADVALATLTVGGNDVTLPPAGSTWQTAGGDAFVLFTFKAEDQPAGGVAIVATVQTTGATVQYAKVTGTETPTFSDSASITFADGDYLYIKVTGTSGSAYYKVQINFVQSGTIKYGKQTFNADHSKPADLSVWDDPTLEIYPIEKIYAADSGSIVTGPDGKSTTKAWAKALWDEDGIYIYLDVIDPDMSSVDAEHESDSFELFVNEGYPNTVYANTNVLGGGSQYRLALNGQVSGEGGSPDAMRALNKWASWKKADGSGYIQVLQAPWRLRSKFISLTSYRNDWEFGFELQLNVAGTTGNRYGVLVWNNIAHTNYQNASDYGVAKLIGQTGTLNYPALAPRIDTQPQAAAGKSPGDQVTFTVAATSLEGGNLSYQWYTTTTGNAVDGTTIGGATSASYSLSALEGTNYYYVAVTNTITTGNPNASATVNSSIVPLIAGGSTLPDNWIDKVTMVNTSVPVYGFNLPAGDTFADYTKVKLTMKMEDASVSGRLRVWGNYNYATWTDVDTRPGIGNAANDLLIGATDGGSTFTNAWTTFDRTITLTGTNAVGTATGVILLAIGPVPAAGGSGTKTYYVKDITLENADGSKVVKALHPESPLLWGGNGAGAYVTQNGADAVTRELVIPSWVDKVTMVNTSVPVYGFNLPSGDTFADYTKVKLTMKMEDASVSGRLRVWGNYNYATWTDVDTRPGIGNAANDLLIGATDGGSTFTNAWTTFDRTITLTGTNAVGTATGVILLAIGPVPAAGGSGTKTYYVKNITLENADGTKVVEALHPESPLLWGGNGASAYVTQNGADVLTRELESDDPTE